MPRSSSKIANDVATRSRGVSLYLRRIELAYSLKTVSKSDVERAYAGAFMLYTVSVERAIERLFIGLLVGELTSTIRGVKPLITVRSHRIAGNIVRGERKYVDWLPYERHTKKRAESFFANGLPFGLALKPELDALEDLSIIRNAIAHDSKASQKRFESRFVLGKSLPPDQTRPASYLRGPHSAKLRRMDILSSAALSAIKKISA